MQFGLKPDDTDILYVGFLLGHGGDALQMLELAAGMMVWGNRVKIVVPALETSIAFSHLCHERGVPTERSLLLRADAHRSRQNLLSLLRFFRTFRAPIVHLHTGNVCLPRFALLALELLRMPRVLVTVHSPYDTLTQNSSRARHWARAVSRRVHKVVCPSDHNRRTQIRYGVTPERVQTIYNSVQVARFQSGDGRVARQALGLSADVPLIVFSSRLDEQKRPLEAVEAFRRIADLEGCQSAHFAFVGRGALEADLKTAVSRTNLSARVHFVGHQSNVPDWLAASDAWILPTESENFSLAVLEALAAGCAVVSTLCPGNDEVLANNENALTVAVGDIAAQASALRRLLTDKPLRTRLGACGRATARQFTVERMLEGYARCYTEMKPSWPSERENKTVAPVFSTWPRC